jgi:hypothetical protein
VRRVLRRLLSKLLSRCGRNHQPGAATLFGALALRSGAAWRGFRGVHPRPVVGALILDQGPGVACVSARMARSGEVCDRAVTRRGERTVGCRPRAISILTAAG